ncbi:hypothetical protein [uncultured Deinococcus sp.]|uniref:hypothetical protein n=1 Tax=uncultured Deinococcus sp. TaxID=158789 RepID=UPI0025E96F43|nr:hypothetical protein [uncultured Deinococcus sp.]
MSKKRTDKTMLAEKIVYLVRVNGREVDVDAASADELAAKLAPVLKLSRVDLDAIAHTIYATGTRVEAGNWRIRRVGTRPFVADEGIKLPGQTPIRKVRQARAETPVKDWQEVEMSADNSGGLAS